MIDAVIAMRTTLSIDDDVLVAAKALAEQQKRPVGEVISDLARRSLHGPRNPSLERNGIPLLDRRSDRAIVTLDLVNALRDDTP